MRRFTLPLLAVLILFGLWEVAAQSGALADLLGLRDTAQTVVLVPAPSDVGDSLWQDRELLSENGWVTLQEVLGGLLLATVLGIGFAIWMHLSETVRHSFYPLLVASQTIPVVAIAPILIIWLGFGIGPKLFVIALICFFPITVNTLDGLRSVDPGAIRMMRTLDAGRGAILRRVELPAALPHFFSGAKLAVAFAPIGAVFGEYVSAEAGLGHLIRQSHAQLLTDRVFAAIAVLSAFALALFGLLSVLQRRFGWWGRESLR